MSDGRGVLREVAWRELFPWLIIFRTFRLALFPCLAIALLGAVLTPLGWRLGHWVFGLPESHDALALEIAEFNKDAPQDPLRIAAKEALYADSLELGRFPGQGRRHYANVLDRMGEPWRAFSDKETSPVVHVFSRFSTPIFRIYRTETEKQGFGFYFFGTLWTLAVWALVGGMITRIAAVELGREEQASLKSAARVTVRRWFDFFTAPLYPILGTFLVALFASVVGLLLYSSDVGAVIAGVLWIFVLLGGALAALLLLWLFIGWPLMWPAIAAEETGDSFEAMNRSFAYAFQRPLHYLFYAAVAALFGFICWSVVDFLCQLTLDATHWAVSWGSGHERLHEVLAFPSQTAEPTTTLRVGSSMIRGIESILLALSEAFAYSFFWVAATAIYLLLRQNVDRTEFDEVWSEEEVARYPLPQGEPETDVTAEASTTAMTPTVATAPTATLAPTAPAEPTAPEKPADIENNQAE